MINTSILPNIFSLRVEPEQRRGSVVSHVSLLVGYLLYILYDLQQLFHVNVTYSSALDYKCKDIEVSYISLCPTVCLQDQ